MAGDLFGTLYKQEECKTMSEENYWQRFMDRRQTRRRLLGRLLVASAGSAALVAAACGSNKSASGGTTSATTSGKKYADPGISDTEVKIGNSFSLSGPNAIVGQPMGGAMKAYFQYINEEKGGVNGRKVTFISYDDGYDPTKTLANTRQAVEQDNVFAIAFVFGTPPAAAILPYLTGKKIPLLMPLTAIRSFDNAKQYPWLAISMLSYYDGAKMIAQYITKQYPDAKIGVLSQNGDPGPDFLAGFKDNLGSSAKNLVDTETTLPTDPTDDAQVAHLKGSGATVWFLQSPQKQTVLSLKSAYTTGWRPQIFLGSTNNSVSALQAAGADSANGAITYESYKDPADPQWQNDPAVMEYRTVVTKYQPQFVPQLKDAQTIQAYAMAKTLVYFLSSMKQPTRKGLMDAVRSTKGYTSGLELPGVTLNGSQQSNFLLSQAQFARYDGSAGRWVDFGQVVKV
jgi:branched-chain amino acid transport system substrate-binding protein